MSISQDERERAVFRSRKMYQTDLQSNLSTAWDNGWNDGKRDEKIEIAKNLAKMGMSDEQISQATGLSKNKIASLRSGQ